MPLSSGEQFGHYTIQSLIGKGGMGEVYKALDTKLDREVAIKVLPASLSGDPERLTRFEREAKVLAQLNHPGIASIYGVEDRALVMELVPGPTLADRIAQGPIPPAEAEEILLQIADALEYAHERGVVHRDLKPANIKIDPDDKVKILDFGLAKALSDPTRSGTGDPVNSPTITMGATLAGTILGTAAYMAPEQARGKKVDKRADIWAFGVVVYEMLTGERLFQGDDTVQVLGKVLEQKVDLARVPVKYCRLLGRCLDRNPKDRLRDIGDARLLLEEEPPEPAIQTAPPPSRLRRSVWPAVAGVLAVALAVFAFFYARPRTSEHSLRYTIAPPENSTVQSFAISPDGQLLAIAASVGGKQQLWLRPLDELQWHVMPTTDGAVYPFWSPDSRYIGFFAQGKLKKIAASGGPAQSLCDALSGWGGSWNQEDVIIFSSLQNTIRRVTAIGGVPVDVIQGQSASPFPSFLPDGRHFLYVSGLAGGTSGIYVASLDGKENRRILPDVSRAVFAPSFPGSRLGHIFFARENNLMVLPFDAGSARVSGDPFPVADGVSAFSSLSYVPVTVSETGVLVYANSGVGGIGGSQLGWYDRAGKLLRPVGKSGQVLGPAISPDEKLVAYFQRNVAAQDIWLHDLARDTDTRFTTTELPFAPTWSPKGDRIIYAVNRSGLVGIQQKASSGSSREEMLIRANALSIPYHWSRDSRFIVYAQNDPKTAFDLWYLTVEAASPPAKPTLFLQTDFNELMGQFSPDSHWMAFTSDRSGQREVYVRPFPAGEGEWKISTAGGEQPRWSADGKELFYSAQDGKINAVPVLKAVPSSRPEFEPGVPVPLFESHMLNVPGANNIYQYDVTADGKRFLVATTGSSPAAASPPLTVVVNWLAGVKK